MSTPIYMATMLVAAAISMSRGFCIAAVLQPMSFAIYATLVAAGAFGSLLLSMGSIEHTIKSYPRLWADGRWSDVVEDADGIVRKLALRSLVPVIPLAALFAFLGGVPVAAAPAIAAVALGIATTSTYASIHRATLDLRSFSIANLLRAALAIVLALAGAVLWDWPGAIAGEFVAAFAGAFVSRHYVAALARTAEPSPRAAMAGPDQKSPQSPQNYEKLWLFLGFVLAAIPVYLDRTFVAGHYGTAAAAKYAFVLLFVTAANVFVGIMSQKIGPMLVHMQRGGKTLDDQLSYASRWIAMFAVGWLTAMGCVYLALTAGPFAELGDKYGVEAAMLAAATVLGLAQVTVVMDHVLLSHDRERWSFLSSLIYFGVVASAAIVTLWSGLSLTTFIWLMACAKIAHLAAQSGFLLKHRNG